MSFALFLFLATLITGIGWLLETCWFKKNRQATAKQPKWAEWSVSFFPVFLLVFVLRSFLIEPFRIPTGSLEPTLLIGDFVAVNKYSYGLRFPVWDSKFLNIGAPKSGDIAVFSWPPNTKFDYIKRVIGTPGDKVSYHNKILTINGVEAKQTFIERTNFVDSRGQSINVEKRQEILKGHKHDIFVRPDVKAFDFDITVPEGHYFMMGDNRDSSSDSRYWGFVPDKNLRGRAFVVWLSWNSILDSVRWSRIGVMIH